MKLRVLVVMMGLLGGACQVSGPSSPSTTVARRPVDFIGEVESTAFAPDWTIDPPAVALARGGPDGNVRLGPQTISLVGGGTLEVPASTPGGNWCLSLIHPSQAPGITGEPGASIDDVPRFETNEDWTAPCIIMGGLGPEGVVAWFQVLETVKVDGRVLAVLGRIADVDASAGTITTFDGFEFPTDSTESDCGAPLEDVAGMQALSDWTSVRAVAPVCLFSD